MVLYDFNGNLVHCFVDDVGDLWFIGNEIAEAVGYSDTRQAVRRHCDNPQPLPEEWREIMFVPAKGNSVIDREDVCKLVYRSKKKNAREIARWIDETDFRTSKPTLEELHEIMVQRTQRRRPAPPRSASPRLRQLTY